ncbi:MAG: lipopolysaccharide biosynthesis protein [Flammeovirgaceae bacterium]|nr:MAG: lipopolysaccharide biosynthesis protein [Flammeovirgaceae bacterium]
MKSLRKKLSVRHKNNKFLYYATGFARLLLPPQFFRLNLKNKLAQASEFDTDYIRFRTNYYNKLTVPVKLPETTPALTALKLKKKQKVYFFDTQEYLRYFTGQLKASFRFGDIREVPEIPSLLKSRPITDDNVNSVLLKLNKVRHFIYTNDKKPFASKKNMLVGRGGITRPHRIKFYEMYFSHPLCNIGQTNRWGKNDHWIKERLTIDEQLDYKFILCLEGNDVASNLKWVMSSNSLAVMPKPKFETWFMEGTLIPNHHYIQIKDDYSDLEERLTYYINHPEECLTIIHNANEYVAQFKNKKREDIISLLVLEKYFFKTGQLPYRPQPYYE